MIPIIISPLSSSSQIMTKTLSSSSTSLNMFETPMPIIPTTTMTTTEIGMLADYAPAATSLFNNMKLPAAVVTAGMISLGFATSFPELPSNIRDDDLRKKCEDLKRLHIVVALIAVTSELIVVLWSAVEVNQLTERQYDLASSVWDLIQRDCDLAWSAVNSHFVLGIIGFVTMLALRAYVMLLSARASGVLMTAASTGTGAALCLMISVVNRGVQQGGGSDTSYRYGNTIIDLFQHYAMLLSQAAVDTVSPGPLQLSAIVLEVISLLCMANVLLFANGKAKVVVDDDTNGDDVVIMKEEEEECEEECLLLLNNNSNNNNNNNNNFQQQFDNNYSTSSSSSLSELSKEQRTKLLNCLTIMKNKEEREQQPFFINNNNDGGGEDTSVNIM